jgi:transposase
MSQVTVISGVERRRPWSDEQKLAFIAAASAPGASVARVARAADLRPSQIYRWRRDLARDAAAGMSAEPGFAPLLIQAAGDNKHRSEGGIIVEIGGAVVRIAADVSPTLASAVVRSLRR